jgi:Predicted nucleotide-binding protein containing TIR-like domain
VKPKVFIGSSTKALEVAEAAQRELSRDCEPVLWSQGVFRDTNVPIEDLMNAVSQFDFAVFVFFPEDYVEVRGVRELSVRDNVLFELGLFLGKLGRQRNFFVAPDKSGTFHLPSDLSGITPATYDAGASSLQAAIGTALYQVKDAIRTLGAVTRHQTLLYDSRSEFRPYHFEHRNAVIPGKDNKPASAKGEGILSVLPDSVLKLTRTNTQGRNEIELLKDGRPGRPSIPKKHDPPFRVLRVSCDVQVEGGAHTLRFVAKDLTTRNWADHKTIKVVATSWTAVEVYLRVPSSSDLLFRIDDEDVAVAPSSVFIRGLKIIEEQ